MINDVVAVRYPVTFGKPFHGAIHLNNICVFWKVRAPLSPKDLSQSQGAHKPHPEGSLSASGARKLVAAQEFPLHGN